jgi:hypothetical protein
VATQKDKSVTLLGQILVAHGVLSLGQVHEVVCKQHGTGKQFGQVVQDLGMATRSQVDAALVDQGWRRKQRKEGQA